MLVQIKMWLIKINLKHPIKKPNTLLPAKPEVTPHRLSTSPACIEPKPEVERTTALYNSAGGKSAHFVNTFDCPEASRSQTLAYILRNVIIIKITEASDLKWRSQRIRSIIWKYICPKCMTELYVSRTSRVRGLGGTFCFKTRHREAFL